SAIRPAIRVRVVPDPHVMALLFDEAEGLLAPADVAVELEDGRPNQEQALGRCGDERWEVPELIGIAECAVRAVRCEYIDHRVDIVFGHTDGVPGEQLLKFDDVSNW